MLVVLVLSLSLGLRLGLRRQYATEVVLHIAIPLLRQVDLYQLPQRLLCVVVEQRTLVRVVVVVVRRARWFLGRRSLLGVVALCVVLMLAKEEDQGGDNRARRPWWGLVRRLRCIVFARVVVRVSPRIARHLHLPWKGVGVDVDDSVLGCSARVRGPSHHLHHHHLYRRYCCRFHPFPRAHPCLL